MLKRLEEALADVKLPDQDVPFSSQKGKLVSPLRKLVRLPTDGKVNLGALENLDELEELSELIVRALDALLDYQNYPIPAAQRATE
ncbi:hypothetical protein V6259_19760, partial [Marinomonas sp. TI.3.20]